MTDPVPPAGGDDLPPVELPINGMLDLHTFRPCDTKELLKDYLAQCRARGILKVRIVHGKGTGALRETVHTLLRRMPEVSSFSLGGDATGGWGATIVVLKQIGVSS